MKHKRMDGNRKTAEHEGYLAGLGKPSYILNPYDGRTAAGKAWEFGFERGDSERVEQAKAARGAL